MAVSRRLFVLGDSISIHYDPALRRLMTAQGWEYDRKSGVKEALQNLDDGGLGANGGDSSHCLRYLRERGASSPLKGGVLLVNAGLHDLRTNPETGAKQVPPGEYRQNLTELIALARGAGGAEVVVWARTTPVIDEIHNNLRQPWHRYAADVAQYNEIADEVMASLDVESIDLHGITVALGPNLFCDHVHYHEWVREAQAVHIAEWFAQRFGTTSCEVVGSDKKTKTVGEETATTPGVPGPSATSYHFSTARLVVREWHSIEPHEWRHRELPEVVSDLLTPEVTQSLPPCWHGEYPPERARAWVQERDTEGVTLLAVDHATKEVMGLVILGVFVEGGTISLMLGYLLGSAAWGKGLGTELITGLVAHVRDKHFAHMMFAGAAADNYPSIRILEKAGFVPDEGSADGSADERKFHLKL
eukprot:m.459321 g.459321  ORF g.459321 m.459321 type:complete len:417 (-) comp21720_c0_seq1:1639-2889(-)